MPHNLNIVILGLSITSSWGNGHATTYRHLVSALCRRGHRVLFLERDVPWYAANRDLPQPPYGETRLYAGVEELKDGFGNEVARADLCVVGSYVPDGIELGEWVTENCRGVTAFYDIDTPVTLRKLSDNSCEYLSRELVPRYDLYLSFTGGPTLQHLEQEFGSACARPLYCSVDPQTYYPEQLDWCYDLGYMGTYSADRQAALESLLLTPARTWPTGKFVVAGPQYPPIHWPANVSRIEHLPPTLHRTFYNRQRFTLNLTRSEMVRLGYSPSIRLFEAAACGTAIISDYWPGLEDFFSIGEEILTAASSHETLQHLRNSSPDRCREIGRRANSSVLAQHTGDHRAAELEQYLELVHRPAMTECPAPALVP